MKIYIFVDEEGISGIAGSEYIQKDKLGAYGRQYLHGDVNACVNACFTAGATEVIVRDGHGGGGNITRDQLDPRADLITGDTPQVRFADIEGSDGLILLGYHAMAGTPGAVLEHTYSSISYQNMWLNGKKAGEIGIDAAIAGDLGIPTILVTGDDKTCLEAEDWIPGVVTCQVKKGFSTQGARLISLEKAHALIEEKTMEAIRKISQIPPLVVNKPAILRIENLERLRIPDNPAYKRIDARTYEITQPTVNLALYFNW